MVDNVCLNAVRGISDLVIAPGLINVDFADVRTIMTGMGRALMGTGYGSGDKRAIEAAQQAISSPLLEDVSINGATGILLNITGGPDLTLAEMNEACSLIAEAADPDANIIFGSVIDANAGDEVRITVIATGFNAHVHEQPAPGAGPRPRARARGADGAADAGVGGAQAHARTMASAQPPDRGRRCRRRPRRAVATRRRCSRSARSRAAETINLDEFYSNMEQMPPAPDGRAAAAAPDRWRVDAGRAPGARRASGASVRNAGASDRPARRRGRAHRSRAARSDVAASGRRAGRRGVGVRQAGLPAPRPVRARVAPAARNAQQVVSR